MKKLLPIFSIAILIFSVLFGVFFIWTKIYKSKEDEVPTDQKEYQAHYVMITQDMDTTFWQTVYESAKKEAESDDIYLEQIDPGFSDEYSLEDYLKISIESKVDGIIVYPDGSDAVNQLIDESTLQGIPVVTVINDASDTKRVSFVGVNAYELGMIYGDQIIAQITDTTKNIYVLFHSTQSNTRNDIVFNQITMTLNETLSDSDQLNIQPYYINIENDFDVEEAIRDLFVNSEIRPDILVCMDEIDTECASQAVVDYNMVGDVTIIGYYSSETVLSAIQKNIVAVTVSMDANQLGELSVRALQEYYDMGYVSDYLSVDLHIINKENVTNYLDAKNREDE